MEEKKIVDNSEWYRPNTPAAEEAVVDVFEEAGFYQVKSRNELFEQNGKKKSKRWIAVALIAVAVIVAAIAITATLFAAEEPERDSVDSFFDEYYEYFDDYETEEEVTGKYNIERVEPDPNRELKLHTTEGLEELSLQELYNKCLPGIVGIKTYKRSVATSWGTGVVMTADGYIITNAHVIDGGDAARVIFHDGTEYEAKLVGADKISDIALLKVEAKGLTAMQFVDSALVQVGDTAIAIGNPLGEEFSGSMSTGIISGVSRDVNFQNRSLTLLQTDAALNSGNSGGALFNVYGQVVGITNMKMMGSYTSSIEGVGFAIPSVTVKEMVDAILDEGAVVGRPGLGISVYDLSDLLEGTDLQEEYPEDGMLVQSVTKGSDAEKQGLQVEDVIIEVDSVKATDIDVLRDAIAAKRVGDKVSVKVWRAGEIIDMEIKLIDQNEF